MLASLLVLSLLLIAVHQRVVSRHADGWAPASEPHADVSDGLGHLRLAHRGRHFIVMNASTDAQEQAQQCVAGRCLRSGTFAACLPCGRLAASAKSRAPAADCWRHP